MIPRLTLISALLGALIFLASGCADSVDAPDGATSVRNVQTSLSEDGTLFFIDYEIMDPEGDDKRLRFEVCEADGSGAQTECGVPIRGTAGDGTAYVPTVPAGEFVPHVFHWNLGCGRFVGTERISVEADTEYIGRVYIDTDSSPAAASEPFEVPDSALSAATDCTPPE